MESKILSTSFFNRPTLIVAEELLGKYLVREIGGKKEAYMITEVEAYDGFEDKASHAWKGKTSRTEIMFGEAGKWYVYLCYGIHNMLNIVTGEKGYPAAVLIRGVKGIKGPGRITRTLDITKKENTLSATPESGLWIEDRDASILKSHIQKTPRIGIDYAAEWIDVPYRFVIDIEK